MNIPRPQRLIYEGASAYKDEWIRFAFICTMHKVRWDVHVDWLFGFFGYTVKPRREDVNSLLTGTHLTIGRRSVQGFIDNRPVG